ncbi:MAG: hypothetical protein V9G12_25690 [Microthrixaceae bacterium]
MTAQLAVGTIRAAIARRSPDGIVGVHRDSGSQFHSGPSAPSPPATASSGRWAG